MKDPGPTYHLAMALDLAARGYEELAKSHIIAAMDCPPGCQCRGCSSYRQLEDRKAGIVTRRLAN